MLQELQPIFRLVLGSRFYPFQSLHNQVFREIARFLRALLCHRPACQQRQNGHQEIFVQRKNARRHRCYPAGERRVPSFARCLIAARILPLTPLVASCTCPSGERSNSTALASRMVAMMLSSSTPAFAIFMICSLVSGGAVGAGFAGVPGVLPLPPTGEAVFEACPPLAAIWSLVLFPVAPLPAGLPPAVGFPGPSFAVFRTGVFAPGAGATGSAGGGALAAARAFCCPSIFR